MDRLLYNHEMRELHFYDWIYRFFPEFSQYHMEVCCMESPKGKTSILLNPTNMLQFIVEYPYTFDKIKVNQQAYYGWVKMNKVKIKKNIIAYKLMEQL